MWGHAGSLGTAIAARGRADRSRSRSRRCSRLGARLGGGRRRAARPAAVPASVQDFTYDSFEADYYLVRGAGGKSHLFTTETIVARFPDFDQNRGIVRSIPKADSGIAARHARSSSVTGAGGAPIPWWTEEDEDWVYVLTGDDSYVRGAQTYVISYTMSDVVLRYEDTDADEFYWDTVGTDHAQPFGSVTAHVHVAGDAAAGLLPDRRSATPARTGRPTRCEIGPATVAGLAGRGGGVGGMRSGAGDVATAIGRRSPRAMSTSGRTRTSRSRSASTQGTFAALTPPPPPPYPWWDWILPVLALLSGVGGLIFLLVMRVVLRRNPDDSPVIVQYTPPKTSRSRCRRACSTCPSARWPRTSSISRCATPSSCAHRATARIPTTSRSSCAAKRVSSTTTCRVLDTLFAKNAKPGADVDLGTFAKRPPPRSVTYVRRIDEYTVQRGYRSKLPAWIGLVRGAVPARRLLPRDGAHLLRRHRVRRARTSSSRWAACSTSRAIASGFFAFIILPFVSLPKSTLTLAGGMHKTYLEGIREYLRLAEEDRLRAAQSPRRPISSPPGGARTATRRTRPATASSTCTSGCCRTRCCSAWSASGWR